MAHSQISFKSWKQNVDFNSNFVKAMQWWFIEKLVFELLKLLKNLEQIGLSKIQCNYTFFLTSQKKLKLQFQISSKSWLNNLESEICFSLLK